nr:FAD:protein FMN transferase [Pinirhizobacter soli]
MASWVHRFAAYASCAYLVLASATVSAAPSTRTGSLKGLTMGTSWTATVVVPSSSDLPTLQAVVQAALDRVDAQMSTYKPDSSLSRFNRAPAGTWQQLEPEFFTVLAHALSVARDSEGAYDPTVGPLVDLWGFGPVAPSSMPPSSSSINAARARVGWQRLRLDTATRRALQPGGVALDLSAVAKGFGVDEAGRALERAGIASYLVEVGGELRARGRKVDGSPWRVGVERPDAATAAASAGDIGASVLLEGMSIATSGDYRRFRSGPEGRQSHHIDPATGRPVRGDLASVSMIAIDCMQADAWGTAFSVMGVERSLAFARRRHMPMLIVERRGNGFVEHATPQFIALIQP